MFGSCPAEASWFDEKEYIVGGTTYIPKARIVIDIDLYSGTGLASTITVGHEAFIHSEAKGVAAIIQLIKGNIFNAVTILNTQDPLGDQDHVDYLEGKNKPNVNKFKSFLESLKAMSNKEEFEREVESHDKNQESARARLKNRRIKKTK